MKIPKIKFTKKTFAIIGLGAVGILCVLYMMGLISQVITNYQSWQAAGGFIGEHTMKRVSWNPAVCFSQAFTANGGKAFLVIAAIVGGIFLVRFLFDRFDSNDKDPRGFARNKSGAYGTAQWMSDKELKSVLQKTKPEESDGVILGEYKGEVVALPKDTKLNRNVAVIGAPGTMKSRAIIRNALLQALKLNESVVITDPKGEMYADTAELYRQNGYDVKVYNLIDPSHSDSWNCMSDLNGDTLLAQTLTNVIIGNTSSGKGDHFWDNGEGNLLKALVLYVDQNPAMDKNYGKNLAEVYNRLTSVGEHGLIELFNGLEYNHPARAPFNLFMQSSDTVKSGIILGLGTRLQVLQNEAVKKITTKSDIDLTAPAQRKCAYYIMISDQDTTMAFLSSLFFSFLFIRLTRFADKCPDRKCPVPVNLILDEFNNVGRIGGSEDGSDFARSLSVCRSRDIRVMLAVQSLGQLQNRYPNNLWAEIIGNCDTQLMLGCTDDITAEYVSARSGDMSIQIDTTMTMRKTIAIAQVIPEYRHQEGQGKRRLLTPDEVLRLPHEELLCIIRGNNILKLKKWDYTKHPLASQIVKTSVYDYYRPEDEPLPETETEIQSVQDEKNDRGVKNKPKQKKKKDFVVRLSDPPDGF